MIAPSLERMDSSIRDSVESATPRFAQVVILARLGQAGGLFTYGVPAEFAGVLQPGSLVKVPFRRREQHGVVWALSETTHLPKVRPIAGLANSEVRLHPYQLKLAAWISDYYVVPLSDVLGAMFSTSARKSPRPSMASFVSPTSAGIRAAAEGEPKRSTRQRELLAAIADGFRDSSNAIPVDEVAGEFRGKSELLSALVKKGFVVSEEREVQSSGPLEGRFPQSDKMSLSHDQSLALESIKTSVRSEESKIFLLHGVTGSGKTEVYLQAIDEALSLGKQAIMLVPEISLTPQAVERVASRFQGKAAVLHSQLSERDRAFEWHRVHSGMADIVVGPRSALFAPLRHPGLLIVDEEHDPSYKQDNSPRYNARDAAAVLGRLTGATVVFGSATPDVATFQAAGSGRIALLRLPDRPVWSGLSANSAGPRPMPRVEVVDMRQELKSGNRGIFSSLLAQELRKTIDEDHQALLFLNRRGNATVVLCRDCGHVERCPDCDVPLTYHSQGLKLICHRCDRRKDNPKRCSECGNERIRYLGTGTQRVEQEVKQLLPDARVIRWDRDVTNDRGSHEEIIRTFVNRSADIMVGTQMIAKGLDFPFVTLVGVISADTVLHLPDFRSAERTFQLLTQVAGRAGRASLPSRVIVQSYTPDNYAVQAAKTHDYETFYRQEMNFRAAGRYPPFVRLVRLVRSDTNEDKCRMASQELRERLQQAIVSEQLEGAEIVGPAPCFMSRLKDRFFWQLLLRAPAPAGKLNAVLEHVPAGWSIDVDPVALL